MGFFAIFSMIANLLPYVIKGVEQIHTGASTETKTQIAQQVLGTAVQGATAALPPEQAGQAQAIGAITSAVIAAATQANAANNAAASQANTQPAVVAPVAVPQAIPGTPANPMVK